MRQEAIVGRAARGIVCAVLFGAIGNCGEVSRDEHFVATKVTPARVSVGDDERVAWTLFDRDTREGWTPSAPATVRVSLDRPVAVSHLKVFGAAPYTLSVTSADGQPVGDLQSVSLASLGEGWNVLPIESADPIEALILDFAPTGSEAAPIAEMELWTIEPGTHVPVEPKQVLRRHLDASSEPEPLPAHVHVAAAEPSELTLTSTGDEVPQVEPACGSVSFRLERSPSAYRRAWLAYFADGVLRPFALTRGLQAAPLRRGQWVPEIAAKSVAADPFIDAIDPETLRPGDNRYDFCLPAEAAGTVVLRQARFIGELEHGGNLVDWAAVAPQDGKPTEDASEVLSPEAGEARRVAPGERLIVAFERWVTPDAVVVGSSSDAWALDCLDRSWRAAPERLDVLHTESNGGLVTLVVNDGAAARTCAAVALSPLGDGGGELSSVSVVGSGARRRIDWPRIVLASTAEHFGQLAWVDGWARAPSALSGGIRVEVQQGDVGAEQGVFGRLLERAADSEAPWPVTVTARFADRTELTRTFVLDRNGDIHAKAPGTTGAAGGPSEQESAAKYGKPGESKSEWVDGKGGGSVKLGTHVGVDVPEGALTGGNGTPITIQHLSPSEIPPLDPGLINVTAPAAHGYEFSPHGQKFQKAVEVLLPFDPKLLPEGYRPGDVNAHYFDTDAKRWRPLARKHVDAEQGTTKSLTDHFTTMINAVVVAPDHPQLRQFNPNEMSGIKAADPGAKITLIQPPDASSQGDANLSYPFELPPGRRGLTPNLGLTYSSERGNGWVGMGWDLPSSTITIDTRWGAPRYDAADETETYLLDGQQLAPFAHRGPVKKRTDDTTMIAGETVKLFHARVEGGFRKIIRHGSSPKTYWWEVIDKTGLRSFYGGAPETGGPTDDATLASPNGVFVWALREIRDLRGNSIRYDSVRVAHKGLPNGTVDGFELYPKKIRYTLEPGAGSAPYEVVLQRDSDLALPQRLDVMIDARGGFKRVTADRLRRIEVLFQGNIVRAWELDYAEGAFHKSLLRSIQQFGAGNVPFAGNEHTFEYFDEIREDTNDPNSHYLGFAAAEPWDAGGDSVKGGMPIVADLLGTGEASVLGGAESISAGVHAYLGFNPTSPSKQGSFGVKVGTSRSTSNAKLSFVDINGDGLPDKVFDSGAGFVYRLNQSGPLGQSQFANATLPALGLAALGKESSSTTSAGAEAYPSAFNVLFNFAETFTTGSTYWSDINGDQLPDLVHDGEVYFNIRTPAGQQFVAADSAATPLPITLGLVDTSALLPDYAQIQDDNAERFPLVDVVRIWVAPFGGTVQITAPVQLTAADPDADGVRVAIQRGTTELWSTTIAPIDTSEQTPSGVSSVSVSAGQRIYFRVSSLFDARGDEVSWDPKIEYVGLPAPADANGLSQSVYQASSDFILGGRAGAFVQVPLSGVVKLAGTVTKPATTDDVRLEVLKNGGVVFSQTRAFSSTQAFDIDQNLTVSATDKLTLRFRADSPIDLAALGDAPALELTYVSATNGSGPVAVVDAQGNPLFRVVMPYDMDIYSARLPPLPVTPFVVPTTGTLRVIATVDDTLLSKPVVFTVKRGGTRLAKHTFPATAAPTQFIVPIGVTEDEQLYFEFSTLEDDPLVVLGMSTSVQVTYDPMATTGAPASSSLHVAAVSNRCSRAYRGWAYGGLNGNQVPPDQVIPDGEFCLDELPGGFDEDTDVPDTADEAQDQGGAFEDAALTFLLVPFPAGRACQPPGTTCSLPQEPLWGGDDERLYVTASAMSSSRHGADDLSVPTADGVAGAHVVSRLSYAQQTALAGGAGTGPISGSVSLSEGTSAGVVDSIDMNGDGFPDVVGNGGIQYTTSRGTLSGAANGPSGDVRQSDNKAYSVGIGGNAPEFRANGRGNTTTTGKRDGKSAQNGSQMASIGFSIDAGLNVGSANENADLFDVNGDGLPDRLRRAGGKLFVSFNLGYGFSAEEPFFEGGAGSAITTGNSQQVNAGAGIGFNDGIYGFGGGISADRQTTRIAEHVSALQDPGQTLLDINGDGLLDRVVPAGTAIRVSINTGNGFAPEVLWKGVPSSRDVSESANLAVGGGAYFTIGVPLCLAGCYLIINPGADASLGMQRQEATIVDIDGDGSPDHLFSDSSSKVEVAKNKRGVTNLLRKVRRPMGATVELGYERSGNTFEQPQSRWVLSRVVTFDGLADDYRASHPGADFQLKTFGYAGGFYDRFEREFYGYATVTSIEHDTRGISGSLPGGVPATYGEPYVGTTRTYRNDSFFTHGLLTAEVVDGLDTGVPRRFTERLEQYALREVATGNELTDPAAIKTTLSAVFPEARTTVRRASEGDASVAVETQIQFGYDALGNVVQILDTGDVGLDDDYVATITYTGASGPHAACAARHIVGAADSIHVASAGGTPLRKREASFDCATGELVEHRGFVGDGTVATSTFAYDSIGNLINSLGPANLHGQRYAHTLGYDAITNTHVTSITDSFGHVSTATYDLRFGDAATATDPNGNTIAQSYDAFGRLEQVVGPYQAGTSHFTLRMTYHPETGIPHAITDHIDVFRNPLDPIQTVVFVDGLQRPVQTKKDATIHQGGTGTATDMMIVSGRVSFDHMGRIFEAFYPVVEAKNPAQNALFNPAYDSIPPTRTGHDAIDRITTLTLPDGTATTHAYAIALDQQGTQRLATTTTDAEGRVRSVYDDIRQLTRAVQDFNGPSQPIWTEYHYDPVSQLVAVLDDGGNVTSVTYDLLGRQRVIVNPDTGQTQMVYDPAGNLTQKITATLQAQSLAITYDYEFTRHESTSYPLFPDNDVTYEYGGPELAGQPGNRVGRITKVTDASGTEERRYGKLGELVEEKKTVASDTQGNSGNSPEVWTTSYLYDTWGRMQQMTYPDGELLTYAYDSGGRVRAAKGHKLGIDYPYVQRTEYDKFEQQVYALAGNGIETKHSYNPLDRLLSRIQAGNFQDLHYSYDDVGNVTALKNQVPVPPPNGYGGPVDQTFQYDGLHRLTQASGEWRFKNTKKDKYTLSLAYDTVHNLTSKHQVHDVVSNGGATVPQLKTSYQYSYTYGGTRPHAPAQIGERAFSYDANGNQTGWNDQTNGLQRTIVWDEENRVQEISDNGYSTEFKYDDAGMRVIKRTEQGETIYANQFWTVRNKDVGTKHVFVGDTRIASKVSPGEDHVDPGGDAFAMVVGNWQKRRAERGTVVEEKSVKSAQYAVQAIPSQQPDDNFLFYFHPDHLGSTSYTTDKDGELYEHAQYFPFGETWAHQHADTETTPYLFSSKELDEETGLYYFGARYFDGRTSQWINPDPILDSYLRGEPNEGVFEPRNLALYTHAWNNPLVLGDPDGRDVIIVLGKGNKKETKQIRAVAKSLEKSFKGVTTHIVPHSGLKAKAKKLGNKVSTVIYIGHGMEGLLWVTGGPKDNDPGLGDLATTGGVIKNGAVIGLNCNFTGNDEPFSDHAVEKMKQTKKTLETKGITAGTVGGSLWLSDNGNVRERKEQKPHPPATYKPSSVLAPGGQWENGKETVLDMVKAAEAKLP